MVQRKERITCGPSFYALWKDGHHRNAKLNDRHFFLNHVYESDEVQGGLS